MKHRKAILKKKLSGEEKEEKEEEEEKVGIRICRGIGKLKICCSLLYFYTYPSTDVLNLFTVGHFETKIGNR